MEDKVVRDSIIINGKKYTVTDFEGMYFSIMDENIIHRGFLNDTSGEYNSLIKELHEITNLSTVYRVIFQKDGNKTKYYIIKGFIADTAICWLTSPE